MKKQLFLMTALFVALFVVGCKKNTSEENSQSAGVYTNAIPKDAKMVMAFNFSKMVPTDGLPSELLDVLKTGLNIRNQEVKEFLEYLWKEKGAGIDLTQPTYFFVNDPCDFLVMPVNDKQKVKKLFTKVERLTSQLKDEGDVTYLKEREAMLAFNATTLVFAVNFHNRVKKQDVFDLLTQKETESFASSEDMQKLTKMDGAISFVFNTKLIKESAKERDLKEIKQHLAGILPENIDLLNVCLLGNLSFEDERMDLDFSMYSHDAKNQKAIDEIYQSMEKIRPENVLYDKDMEFAYATNMKGEDLLKILKSRSLTGDTQQTLLFTTLFSNVKGNVSIVVYNGLFDTFFGGGYGMDDAPKMLVKAQIIDVDAVEQLVSMAKTLYKDDFKEIDDHVYYANYDNQAFYIKLKDDYVYVSLDQETLNKADTMVEVDGEIADEMADSFNYLWIDMKKSSSMLSAMTNLDIAIDRFTVAYRDNAQMRMSLVMQDTDMPLIDQLWNIIMAVVKR